MSASTLLSKPFGFLNVEKPSGLTSRKVTSRLHGALAARLETTKRQLKVGHVGTLDPLAGGVLAVAVGPATRLSNLLHEGKKQYLATFRLGLRSDTEDVEGTVEADPRAIPSRDAIEAAIPSFIGAIEQRPPAFSAKMIEGQRAHDLARKGRTVDLPSVTVTVESIDLLTFQSPNFTLRVTCGAGTYVRSLGRDLAAACESSAIMTALVREVSGPFRLDEATPFDEVRADPLAFVQPAGDILRRLMPTTTVDRETAIDLGNGRLVHSADTSASGRTAALCGDELIAVVDAQDGLLQPRLVLQRWFA